MDRFKNHVYNLQGHNCTVVLSIAIITVVHLKITEWSLSLDSRKVEALQSSESLVTRCFCQLIFKTQTHLLCLRGVMLILLIKYLVSTFDISCTCFLKFITSSLGLPYMFFFLNTFTLHQLFPGLHPVLCPLQKMVRSIFSHCS